MGLYSYFPVSHTSSIFCDCMDMQSYEPGHLTTNTTGFTYSWVTSIFLTLMDLNQILTQTVEQLLCDPLWPAKGVFPFLEMRARHCIYQVSLNSTDRSYSLGFTNSELSHYLSHLNLLSLPMWINNKTWIIYFALVTMLNLCQYHRVPILAGIWYTHN